MVSYWGGTKRRNQVNLRKVKHRKDDFFHKSLTLKNRLFCVLMILICSYCSKLFNHILTLYLSIIPGNTQIIIKCRRFY